MVIVIYRTLREDIIKFTLQIHNIVWPVPGLPPASAQLSDVHQHFTFRAKLTWRLAVAQGRIRQETKIDLSLIGTNGKNFLKVSYN